MDSADANAARLILAVLDDPAWKDELPRLVVGSLSRQQRGAWQTTTANLWGALALDKFSAKFESAPVAGRTSASLGSRRAARRARRRRRLARAAGRRRLVASGRAARRRRLPWPTGAATLNVVQEGSGKPWLTVQSLAAVPLKAPFARRLPHHAQRQPVEQKDKRTWSRGDVVRVRLEIDAQSDMTWVVVSDPVPGGATILGSGLGRDSQIATRGEKRAGLRLARVRGAQLRGLPQLLRVPAGGKHVVEYTVRLNNPGRFALPPTRVEAMYAPEMFGEAPNAASRSRRDRRPPRAPQPTRSRSPLRRSLGLALSARAAPRAADVRRGQGGAPAVRRHAARSPRRAAPDACASTRACGASPGRRSPRCRRRCSTAIVAERGPALLRARRRRLAGGGDERVGQPLEHAHARRVDADDAARRPARRRPGAPARRPQRRPEARPGGDRGAPRGELEEERDPRGVSELGAVPRRDRRHRRARADAVRQAAERARRARGGDRRRAGARPNATPADVARARLRRADSCSGSAASASTALAETRAGAARRHAARRAARAALRARRRSTRAGAGAAVEHARRPPAALRGGAAAPPARRARAAATSRTAPSSCSTTRAATCSPGSARAATCRARPRSTACSRGARPARR